MKSIGGLNSIGSPLSPNQIGGEDFIRHIGNDKLILDFHEGSGTIVRDKSHCGNDGIFPYASQYPTQDDDHVKATTKVATSFWAYFATDPSLSLIGNYTNNSWLSLGGSHTNQRFHIDLGSTKKIKRIYYENQHSSGAETNKGANNFTFWGSNEASDFADLVYGNDGTWVELTVAQNTFDQHVASDEVDPKYITVTNSTAYRYYAFKFADNYGHPSYLGVRRIELQAIDFAKNPTWKRNSLYFDGGDYIGLAHSFLAKSDFVNGGSVLVTCKFSAGAVVKIIDIAGAWMLWFNASGNICADIDGSTGGGGSSVSSLNYGDNCCYCIIVTWDKETDATVKNIIDGVEDGSSTQQLYNIDDLNRLSTIGSMYNGTECFYTGGMKKVRILSKCLSGIEAQNEYLCNKFSNN